MTAFVSGDVKAGRSRLLKLWHRYLRFSKYTCLDEKRFRDDVNYFCRLLYHKYRIISDPQLFVHHWMIVDREKSKAWVGGKHYRTSRETFAVLLKMYETLPKSPRPDRFMYRDCPTKKSINLVNPLLYLTKERVVPRDFSRDFLFDLIKMKQFPAPACRIEGLPKVWKASEVYQWWVDQHSMHDAWPIIKY